MTIPEILKELESDSRRFPREAMRAAIEQQQAITPELLRVLEAVAAEPLQFTKRKNYMLPVFAMYLLAQFREKLAYPVLIKIASGPEDTAYEVLGDTITGGLNLLLASFYDGNPAPLKGLIENEQADEFVRSAAIDTFVTLERTGQMPRAVVLEYWRSLFHGKLEREPSFAWDGLADAVAELPAPELLEEVRQAYADDVIDPTVATLEEIEQEMAATEPPSAERHHLITDAIAEMERWGCFRQKDDLLEEDDELEADEELELEQLAESMVPEPVESAADYTPPPPPKPIVREAKTGRNDPCPCGSGKKFKKCCGKG